MKKIIFILTILMSRTCFSMYLYGKLPIPFKKQATLKHIPLKLTKRQIVYFDNIINKRKFLFEKIQKDLGIPEKSWKDFIAKFTCLQEKNELEWLQDSRGNVEHAISGEIFDVFKEICSELCVNYKAIDFVSLEKTRTLDLDVRLSASSYRDMKESCPIFGVSPYKKYPLLELNTKEISYISKEPETSSLYYFLISKQIMHLILGNNLMFELLNEAIHPYMQGKEVDDSLQNLVNSTLHETACTLPCVISYKLLEKIIVPCNNPYTNLFGKRGEMSVEFSQLLEMKKQVWD